MQSTREYGNIIRDFVVLSLLLGALNLLLDRADFGWLLLNPTPWMLPAALIGARYGFTAGLASGILVTTMIVGVKSQVSGDPFTEVFRSGAYFYLTIVVVGAATGEMGSLLGRRKAKLANQDRRLEEENLRLRSQLNMVDETRQQLQQQLALLNAPLCSLDADLRALLGRPESEFDDQLLRLLHRSTGITSAGVYLRSGARLDRSAVIHPTPPLQQSLTLAETPLADRALTTGVLAAVPDVSDLSTRQPFLAAYTWTDHAGKTRALLVQDMPMQSFTAQNLARIQTVLSWATVMSVLRHTFRSHDNSRRPVSENDFKIFLNEARNAERAYGLPSALVRLDVPAGGDWNHLLPKLADSIVAVVMPQPNSLGLLLPFSGENEAEAVIGDARQTHPDLVARKHLITGSSSTEELWHQLTLS